MLTVFSDDKESVDLYNHTIVLNLYAFNVLLSENSLRIIYGCSTASVVQGDAASSKFLRNFTSLFR